MLQCLRSTHLTTTTLSLISRWSTINVRKQLKQCTKPWKWSRK